MLGALGAAAPALADSAAERYAKAGELIQAGKLKEAKQELEQAVRLDPKHVDSRRVLASILKKEGKHEAAAKHLVAALEAEPESVKLMSEAANAYADAAVAAARDASTKKRDELAARAADLYRRVYEKDPEFLPALYNLGTMHCLMERWAEAAATLEEYVAKKPEDARGLFNYAQACDKASAPAAKTLAAWEAFVAAAEGDPRAKKDVSHAKARIRALRKK